MYFVYILESLKTGRYYIGQTNNIERRLAEHNSGKRRWTKSGVPWMMVYKEEFATRSEAVILEYRLKKIKKRVYLEKYIAG